MNSAEDGAGAKLTVFLYSVGQGVYVGAIGRDCVGLTVIVGSAVCVGSAVTVIVGVSVIVGVGEAALRLSRLNVRKEPTRRSKTTPATPPMIHGNQSISLLFFLTTSLKSDGTEIKTTVVLSCPRVNWRDRLTPAELPLS